MSSLKQSRRAPEVPDGGGVPHLGRGARGDLHLRTAAGGGESAPERGVAGGRDRGLVEGGEGGGCAFLSFYEKG